ncbi:MAG: Gfo/Idh/MocA family oxidoreductase [Pontiellaceae bacterium]|nr:Gfo/Idh/MocA family oxidoreductase [Pontiellaceae bacterium]
MSNNVGERVWLVGAGKMAVEYAKVLASMNITPVVVGRGELSAAEFTKQTGIKVVTGGLEAFINSLPEKPTAVIIAVNVLELSLVTRQILDYAQPRILIEKPVGIDAQQLQFVRDALDDAAVFVAYNRRFFSSVQKAKKILEDDGGPLACAFEFTEWGHVIEQQISTRPAKELAHWALANSSHIFDLAFFLSGSPEKLSSYCLGGLSWHPNASRFSGSGITTRGAMFSYHANWDAPGRWKVEVMSANYRVLLCPLEKLQLQKKGSVAWEEVPLDDELDQRFKPGLHAMLSGFLAEYVPEDLCKFSHVERMLNMYQKIAGYPLT